MRSWSLFDLINQLIVETYSNSLTKPMKVFFYAIDGTGHQNACVGMAQALAARGHSIYFLLNDAFKGQYTKFGFEEILLTQKAVEQPNSEPTDKSENNQAKEEKKNPVKEMAQMLKDMGFLGPESPLEKLKNQMKQKGMMEKFYKQAVEYDPQIEAAMAREKPDVIIMDTFLVFPSVRRQTRIPWIMLYSPNPIFLYQSDKLPPFSSGYPTNSDPATWQEFNELLKLNWENNFLKFQIALDQHFNFDPQDPIDKDKSLVILSPYLNIYGFPQELDYHDIVPRPDNFIAVDAFCRKTPEPFQLPKGFHNPGEKLIYFSLGSMRSIDIELVQKILAVLAKTSHKYIVSKGQMGDAYQLPANCWGENFLPQTSILPLVDLVITHGGNNTVTETFTFGKPMIVMGLFGDQYCNAQRIQEKGYGIRIEPYSFKPEELINAIDKLLNDKELHQRLKVAAERIQSSNSKDIAAQRIEEVVAKAKAGQ